MSFRAFRRFILTTSIGFVLFLLVVGGISYIPFYLLGLGNHPATGLFAGMIGAAIGQAHRSLAKKYYPSR